MAEAKLEPAKDAIPGVVVMEERVKIKDDVEIEISQREDRRYEVTVKGPKGEVTKEFYYPDVYLWVEDDEVVIAATKSNRRQKAILGMIKAYIKNMQKGVTEGHEYKLKLVYSHFPPEVKVDQKEGKVYIENFMGENVPRVAEIVDPKNTEVIVQGQDIIVRGIDKEAVGQTAANLEQATYIKDRDPRVFQDGIYIVEKDGKKVV
nr:50S ribosomal protein L6 [Methanopyrus sp. SNP6]